MPLFAMSLNRRTFLGWLAATAATAVLPKLVGALPNVPRESLVSYRNERWIDEHGRRVELTRYTFRGWTAREAVQWSIERRMDWLRPGETLISASVVDHFAEPRLIECEFVKHLCTYGDSPA